MADRQNLGTPGSGGQNVPALRCPEAEPLFTGYIDGSLDPASRARLEFHLSTCSPCAAEFKQMEKGLAWLKILRHEDAQMQPPAGLVEKILARTATQEQASALMGELTASSVPARVKPWSNVNLAAVRANVRRTGLLEPRLMLTAAMAFFSISITLNVAGIRLNDLRPMNLRHTVTRTYSDTSAHVTRYYENMRVVYQLESRVRELRRAAETDAGRVNRQEHKAQPEQDAIRSAVQHGQGEQLVIIHFSKRRSSPQKPQQEKEEPEPAPVTGDVLEARMDFSLAAIQRSLA